MRYALQESFRELTLYSQECRISQILDAVEPPIIPTRGSNGCAPYSFWCMGAAQCGERPTSHLRLRLLATTLSDSSTCSCGDCCHELSCAGYHSLEQWIRAVVSLDFPGFDGRRIPGPEVGTRRCEAHLGYQVDGHVRAYSSRALCRIPSASIVRNRLETSGPVSLFSFRSPGLHQRYLVFLLAINTSGPHMHVFERKVFRVCHNTHGLSGEGAGQSVKPLRV